MIEEEAGGAGVPSVGVTIAVGGAGERVGRDVGGADVTVGVAVVVGVDDEEATGDESAAVEQAAINRQATIVAAAERKAFRRGISGPTSRFVDLCHKQGLEAGSSADHEHAPIDE